MRAEEKKGGVLGRRESRRRLKRTSPARRLRPKLCPRWSKRVRR